MLLKSAFTMIELIFVIVIIGILAAVAIPKLSATRDDAKIETLYKNIKEARNEIAAFALAKNSINYPLSYMSKIIETMINQGNAVEVDNSTINFKAGNITNCVSLKKEYLNGNINLILQINLNNNDKICKPLQDKIKDISYPIALKGARVIR